MLLTNKIIFGFKIFSLTIPLIIIIGFYFLFKQKIDLTSIFIKTCVTFLFSKEIEPLLIIMIVGILILILVLYTYKNSVENEFNKYTFSKIYSPKTYEKVKKNLTDLRIKELKNTPQYKKMNQEKNDVASFKNSSSVNKNVTNSFNKSVSSKKKEDFKELTERLLKNSLYL